MTATLSAASLDERIDRAAAQPSNPKVIAWRRDLHQHPELGNREFRTSKLVAEHLQRARHRGADADRAHRRGRHSEGRQARPRGRRCAPTWTRCRSTEQVDVPFTSKARTTWNGQDVGVMHACGHDAHVAILMGVAEVLVRPARRDSRHGVVHLPARRRRRAGGRGRRRAADGQGRRAREPGGRCDLRPARHVAISRRA